MVKPTESDGDDEAPGAAEPERSETRAPWEAARPAATARAAGERKRAGRTGKTIAPVPMEGTELTPAWLPPEDPASDGDEANDGTVDEPPPDDGPSEGDAVDEPTEEHRAAIAFAETRAPERTEPPLPDGAITPSSDPDQTAVSGDRADTVRSERFEPGTTIPTTRYRVVEVLGEGGMGVVYEAEHLDIGRHVALKVLRSGFGPTSPAVRQFRTEARAASKIGSEHIADVFDFAELPDGRLLFAMELLDGPDLAEELEHGPMSLERAIPILRQVCIALAAAHDQDLVHRDIKPSNVVLVTERGRSDTVKVVDFGVSTMLKSGAVTEELAGTPFYVAPEIILGLPFDQRVDLYSFGCMAFQMLVGRPPFSGRDVDELFAAHVDTAPPVPSRSRDDDDLPTVLDEVIAKCLAKKPRDRYADMRDVHAAICEAQVAAGITTAWDDLPVPEVDPERRDAILRGFAQLAGEGPLVAPRTRWLWPAIALVALAVALTLWLWPGAPGGEADEVTRLTNAARTAAAAAHYVYPTRRDPNAETAYGYVLALERIRGPEAEAAHTAAAQLRQEFATTLVGLADDYWQQEGGKAFAIEYYKQALAFDPTHAMAGARAELTAAELSELRDKTENKSFDDEDLLEEPPLVVDGEAVVPGRPRPAGTLPSTPKKPSPPEALPPPPPPADLGPPPPPESTSNPLHEPKGPTARDLVRDAGHELKGGNPDAAAELFARALTLDSRNRSALASLSDIEFDRGNYDAAARYAKRAVDVAPRSGANRIRLGDAYFRLSKWAEAKAQYEKAAELGHDGASYRLEKVQAKLGQ